MQGFFEDNPAELAAIKRDKALHTVRVQEQLAHVPDYLVPGALRPSEPEASADCPAPPQPAKRKTQHSYGSAKRHKYQVK